MMDSGGDDTLLSVRLRDWHPDKNPDKVEALLGVEF